MDVRVIFNTFLILIVVGIFACRKPESVDLQHKQWQDYGGGPDQSKFVTLDEINKSNVDQLEKAWFYPAGDDHEYQFNPIIADTVMYLLAKNRSLVALDARTGEEIWIHANLEGITKRGINYWESEDSDDKRLLFQMNDYLQAIDAETGKSILSFGKNGLVDLKEGLGRDPKSLSSVQSRTPGKIFKNLIILGSAPGEGYMSGPGHLRAYDVVTGEHVWTFHTIPQPGQFGYDTWPEDAYKYAGGVNTWSEISIDQKRGIAYFPLGSPTYDYYGADRKGKNLFGNSLLALDARTGERLWHFQVIHHDLWDYDLSSAPQLVTVNQDGKQIDAVAVAGKHGYLFAFNRVTGEPLWPIEERKVPESHVPGEQAWPTQPIPTVLPPFNRREISSDDLTPYFLSDEERAKWKQKIKRLEKEGRTKPFTPLSHKYETVTLPGASGGANWGGTAAYPEKGMVYVITKAWPSFYSPLGKRNYDRDEDETPEPTVAKGRNFYREYCSSCHGIGQNGAGAGPVLQNIGEKFSYETFKQLLQSGGGEMPAFSYLETVEAKSIYRFLGGNQDGEKVTMPEGPVVASGGAPGGQKFRKAEDFEAQNAYPRGVDAPERYYLDGYGLGEAYIMAPPWSKIVAYNLNKGSIEWSRPLGEDKLAVKEGGNNTGVPQNDRLGMIVTSTGLLFATSKDGKIRAYNADNGDVLWEGSLPRVPQGLPAMYEVDCKHYIVVPATIPFEWVWAGGIMGPQPGNEDSPGGYVVFSLPE